jgi:hypothetical protein
MMDCHHPAVISCDNPAMIEWLAFSVFVLMTFVALSSRREVRIMKNALLYCGLGTVLISSNLIAAPVAGPSFNPCASMLAADGGSTAPADKDGDKDEEDEQKVTVKDLPAAVSAGAARAYPTGQITGAEKKEDDGKIKNGKTVYELDVKSGGKNLEVKVAEDGTVLSQKEDDDKD